MAAGISAQVLEEVRELRLDIHKIDTKLEVHIAQDAENCKKLNDVYKEMYGNGDRRGLKNEASIWFEEHADKKAAKKHLIMDAKSLIIAFLINTGLAVLLAKIIP